MNCQALPIFLPILRKENAEILMPSVYAQGLKLNIAYLWPGLLDASDGYWQPSDYPFSAKDAKRFFDDFCAMGDAALMGMPVHALMEDESKQLSKIKEQDALAAFSKDGEFPSSDELTTAYALNTAQKILLWAWLLEERFYEINDLSKSYAKGAKNLANMLGVEQDEGLLGLERIETELFSGESFLPPWKLVLENAAYFLEDNSFIVVNHRDMLAQVLDVCEKTLPLSDELMTMLNCSDNTINASTCSLDLGQILGKSERQKQKSPILQKKLNLILLENI